MLDQRGGRSSLEGGAKSAKYVEREEEEEWREGCLRARMRREELLLLGRAAAFRRERARAVELGTSRHTV